MILEMRACSLVLLLAVALTGSTVAIAQKVDPAANCTDPLSLEEILRTFRFPQNPNAPLLETNATLIAAIKDRRVRFLLDSDARSQLKDAGATKELLETIDTFIAPREAPGVVDDAKTIERKKKRIREISQLENQIRTLFAKKDVETRKKLIGVGKEYLAKFGNDTCCREMAEYLKTNIPKWEERVKLMEEID